MKINEQILLIIGSNINKNENISKAYRLLQNELDIISSSNIFETEHTRDKHQESYYNFAVSVKTSHDIYILKKNILLPIEQACYRIKNPVDKFVSRTLDIDICFYGQKIICDEKITVPDKDVTKYLYILAPLVEIAPNFNHPQFKKNILFFYSQCTDKCRVLKTDMKKELLHAI